MPGILLRSSDRNKLGGDKEYRIFLSVGSFVGARDSNLEDESEDIDESGLVDSLVPEGEYEIGSFDDRFDINQDCKFEGRSFIESLWSGDRAEVFLCDGISVGKDVGKLYGLGERLTRAMVDLDWC